MDFTIMTMEELSQMEMKVRNEINRRNKIEEEKAIKEFMDAFTKVAKMASVIYDGWDKSYNLTDPTRFHFQSL